MAIDSKRLAFIIPILIGSALVVPACGKKPAAGIGLYTVDYDSIRPKHRDFRAISRSRH